MLNKDGYRYLQDYDLGKPQPKPVLRSMELGPRDRLSQAFVKEQERGRTLEGPYGHYVHLDIRHLGAKVINSKLPFVRELCMKYENIDPIKEMIPVRPVVHYMMGGIHTDIIGATPLKGLYAAGETACVSINGANRLGSNSLTELLVFGNRAGRNAAEYALTQDGANRHISAMAFDEAMRIDRQFLNKSGGKEKIAGLRKEMHTCMEEGAGIYRTELSLKKSQDKVKELQERFNDVAIEDHSKTFNTELISAFELSYLLDIAESIVQCALNRKESRGSHQRIDFPKRDDEKFLAHSLASRRENDVPEIKYTPVTITRWPPGERVYGR
jgi:fumarate reductase flavoprotein subunit